MFSTYVSHNKKHSLFSAQRELPSVCAWFLGAFPRVPFRHVPGQCRTQAQGGRNHEQAVAVANQLPGNSINPSVPHFVHFNPKHTLHLPFGSVLFSFAPLSSHRANSSRDRPTGFICWAIPWFGGRISSFSPCSCSSTAGMRLRASDKRQSWQMTWKRTAVKVRVQSTSVGVCGWFIGGFYWLIDSLRGDECTTTDCCPFVDVILQRKRSSFRAQQVAECRCVVVRRLATTLLALLGHGTSALLPPLLPRAHLQLDAVRWVTSLLVISCMD